MFGLFKSRKQKLFNRYHEVIDGATLAGAAMGYLQQQGNDQGQKDLEAIYEEYETWISKLMSDDARDDGKFLMQEMFNDASRDADLVSIMNSNMVDEIKNELARNINLAKQTLERNV